MDKSSKSSSFSTSKFNHFLSMRSVTFICIGACWGRWGRGIRGGKDWLVCYLDLFSAIKKSKGKSSTFSKKKNHWKNSKNIFFIEIKLKKKFFQWNRIRKKIFIETKFEKYFFNEIKFEKIFFIEIKFEKYFLSK